MVKNDLKMPKCFSVLLVLSSITITTCDIELYVVKRNDYGQKESVPTTIEAFVGSNLTLTCVIESKDEKLLQPKLVWGRRTKDFRFKNEIDLKHFAEDGSKHIYDLQKENEPYHISEATKSFTPLKITDRGVHFCMSLKYMMFLIVHIKVKERFNEYSDESDLYDIPITSVICKKDKFRCVKSGHCINSHYKCDGRPDCYDGSDEDRNLCHGDPCRGKIQCDDGRCIPTAWCCNQRTDINCNVTVAARPSCCPPLPDPYDPTPFYEDKNKVKEMNKGNGSRYLFITICVISAVLSFVLFLFVISKICGFDSKPSHSRNINIDSRNQTTTFADFSRCGHSECAIRREFNPNSNCLYRTPTPSDLQNLSSGNNSEIGDPLIINGRTRSPIEISDQPPPYSEVVSSPLSVDKGCIDDLINAPPPPYSSTNFFTETESRRGNNISASNCANVTVGNCGNNQSTHCDIGTTSDRSNE